MAGGDDHAHIRDAPATIRYDAARDVLSACVKNVSPDRLAMAQAKLSESAFQLCSVG